MAIEFEISALIPAHPEVVYGAWLDSESHTKMTGGEAKASSEVGGEFEAWDGYIRGKNLELEYGKRIVQSWRTAEFADSEAVSRLEITFDREGEGTLVTLRHTNLPTNGEQYKQGWVDNYFEPMKEYFGGRA